MRTYLIEILFAIPASLTLTLILDLSPGVALLVGLSCGGFGAWLTLTLEQ